MLKSEPFEMTIEEFCIQIAGLELSQWQQAVAILWYHDRMQPDVVMSAGQLAKVIHETGLGVPHSTQLGKAILRSGLVLTSAKGFRLKSLSRPTVSSWLQAALLPATRETATSSVANSLASLAVQVLDPAELHFRVDHLYQSFRTACRDRTGLVRRNAPHAEKD